jgi:hypothetical protein
MNYRKRLGFKFYAICQKCMQKFDLNKDHIAKREEKEGIVPLSASSAVGSVLCPSCNSDDIHVHFEYHNDYRRKCIKCKKMFDTPFSWKDTCNQCLQEKVEIHAHMGPR